MKWLHLQLIFFFNHSINQFNLFNFYQFHFFSRSVELEFIILLAKYYRGRGFFYFPLLLTSLYWLIIIRNLFSQNSIQKNWKIKKIVESSIFFFKKIFANWNGLARQPAQPNPPLFRLVWFGLKYFFSKTQPALKKFQPKPTRPKPNPTQTANTPIYSYCSKILTT